MEHGAWGKRDDMLDFKNSPLTAHRSLLTVYHLPINDLTNRLIL